MFIIKPRTRIREWVSSEDEDCYETGYEISDSDGEIVYDFANEATKNWYEELNKKEGENAMTKQVNRQKDYEEYLLPHFRHDSTHRRHIRHFCRYRRADQLR